MKRAGLFAATFLGAMVLCFGQESKPGDGSIKGDLKEAGQATKHAAKKTGHKIKKTSKKVVNKSAEKVEEGADKVKDKTAPK